MGEIRTRSDCYSQGVPRPIDQAKRETLLRDIRTYISDNGLADLSLRPLAAALGTSDRMLIHYFGTKDNLLAQALADQKPAFHLIFDNVDSRPALQSSLRTLWQSMTSGEDVQSVRILLQAMGIACTGPGRFTAYVTTMFDTLTDALTHAIQRCGSAPEHARIEATVLAATFRGLLFDRLITDDEDRTSAAVERLIHNHAG
ncbi:TetR/AcrR family transcriptional regulator [Nocardia jiangsuensis]|uniref:TetR/AcrR family transcriptional regulator n=1 Tax=Nocardia jiangsuensis TaxID=1691563 RepID=A0ABV8DMN8_9NOCA